LGAAVRERCEAAYYSDDVLTEGKRKNLEALSDARGVIAALAMDQRGALEKPLAMACGVAREEITPAMMAEFKAAARAVFDLRILRSSLRASSRNPVTEPNWAPSPSAGDLWDKGWEA
jgi:hypothetical protein